MTPKQTFITNSGANTLKHRLVQLIGYSEELKFLIGFFYFSGISALYEGLRKHPDLQIKVLVGLNVDKQIHGLVEYGDSAANTTANERFNRYLESLGKSVNSEDFDNQAFYQQVRFFLDLVRQDRLVIRKTYRPNHAKLYIFKLKEDQFKKSVFVTGSSNLTRAGLGSQEEFNVELSDYGTEETEAFFDALWLQADKITENDEFKKRLLDLLENKTLVTDVTPFEAFVLVLKTYLDTQEQKVLKQSVTDLLVERGYAPYKYQLDAVSQALTMIDNYGGVIVSDVVGLGKSVIASMVARSLGKRGVVICRPSLIGDDNAKSGWNKYREEFKLYDWAVRSAGKLEAVLDLVTENPEYEVVIVDEAHNFRNQDTEDYELLSNICRNRIVILLTATPFNNTPSDIFSLLKLFIVPGKSKITLDNNLDVRFRVYKAQFEKLSYIKRHHNSRDEKKRARALSYYESLFGTTPVELPKVVERAKYLAEHIRSVIEPVLIRRNRIDLKTDPEYSQEVYELSEVADPKELFFELSEAQSEFYDQVINELFCEGGRFKGAIYQPYNYEAGSDDEGELPGGQEKNREKLTQRNLYDFMRRLLVKRFESSFGAFEQSIRNFIAVTTTVQAFIEKTNRYILDRQLIEKIYEYDGDQIEQELLDFAEKLKEGNYPKTNKIYEVDAFAKRREFLKDIASDLQLFNEILARLDELNLVADDPKLRRLVSALGEILASTDGSSEPQRKVVIFTEYEDTARYLEPLVSASFPGQTITSKGDLTPAKVDAILANFDSTHAKPRDDAQILLATDQLSEGFNLNRAGAVINYDIPWNPTRVIQRVGRINRISKKIFDELHVFNFFPTKQGADIIQSREIAANKMFLIHNTLGEDAKIFEADEMPTASKLFKKINRNPEDYQDQSPQTIIRRKYFDIAKAHPETVAKVAEFAPRVKTAKTFGEDQLLVFIRKGLGFFVRAALDGSGHVEEPDLTAIISFIECRPGEPILPLSETFWERYEAIKNLKEQSNVPASELSIEKKALNNLKTLLQKTPQLEPHYPFIRMLLEDVLEYKTLPDYTLRKIGNLKAGSPAEAANAGKVLAQIRDALGPDYLARIKASMGELAGEVIIAVENRKP